MIFFSAWKECTNCFCECEPNEIEKRIHPIHVFIKCVHKTTLHKMRKNSNNTSSTNEKYANRSLRLCVHVRKRKRPQKNKFKNITSPPKRERDRERHQTFHRLNILLVVLCVVVFFLSSFNSLLYFCRASNATHTPIHMHSHTRRHGQCAHISLCMQ